MSDEVNRIRNSRFDKGKSSPRSWEWVGDDRTTWQRRPDDEPDHGIVIESGHDSTIAFFSQKMRCKSEDWYRFEADVTASLAGSDRHSGANLWIRPVIDDEPAEDHIRLAGTLTTSGPLTLRGVFKTPPGTRAIIIEVGLSDACGEMTIHDVFACELIEPDQTSHPMALPPPTHAQRSPRRAKRVALCSDDATFNPLSAILGKRFGPRQVACAPRKSWRDVVGKTDAILFPDEKVPTGLRSLKALLELAAQHVVIISTSAFASIVGNGLQTRDIEQDDDPLFAKVVWGDHMTRGFVLHDVFPFAWQGEEPREQVHRQFRKGPAFTKLLKEHGFVTLLESMTDSDATSEKPMALHKATDGGGLTVIDMEPMAELPSSAGEPNVAVYLLLDLLGLDQSGLGQYTVPEESEQKWFELLRDFTPRYYVFNHQGRSREDTIIQVGEDDETLGLPAARRKAILIRTGIRGDDFAGIYGTMYFLKHLVRLDPPNETPYARALAGKFRLAWIPLCNPWQNFGWSESLVDDQSIEGEFDPGDVAAVIDITDADTSQMRVVYDHHDADFDRQAGMIVELARKFSSDRFFYRGLPADQSITRHDQLGWQMSRCSPEVTVDDACFATPMHAAARECGAQLIRIEIPGGGQDFICNSIWRTDLAATTLEHVLGLQFGLIAMNRGGKPIAFSDHPPIKPGECIIVPHDGTPGSRSMRAG